MCLLQPITKAGVKDHGDNFDSVLFLVITFPANDATNAVLRIA
jgi:hypothetical protein